MTGVNNVGSALRCPSAMKSLMLLLLNALYKNVLLLTVFVFFLRCSDDGVVPVTPEFTVSSSSAAAPFSGFSFGQIKAPESKPALSFGSIPQQVSKSKTEEGK